MKYLTFILFLFCALQTAYSQEEPPVPSIELNVQTEGGDAQDVVEFKLIPQGIQFCKQAETGCDVNVYASMTSYSVELKGDEICLKSGFGHRDCDELNNLDTSNCQTFTAWHAPLRMSYYKVEVYVNSNLEVYFYYDNRDASFVNLSGCGNNSCTGNDFTVRYNFTTENLEFYELSNTNPFAPVDQILSDGDVITWSDWKCDEPDFLPFWLINIVEENGNPKIMWGPYSDNDNAVQNYKVYRAVNHSTPPPMENFNLVTTVNSGIYEWIDTDYGINGPLNAHYYVVARLVPFDEGPGFDSPPTNVFTIGVGLYKESINVSEINQDYVLGLNYPNPFNPSTHISFGIKETEYVTLIVYDVLGKEVARLIDGIKAAGSYQVEFDARQLPSGIYFYELQSGTFKETKKMILNK